MDDILLLKPIHVRIGLQFPLMFVKLIVCTQARDYALINDSI